MENRDLLRKKILGIRKNLSSIQRIAFSNQIFYQIIHWEPYQKAESIFSYLSFSNEVITNPLIEYSLKKNKKIGVPAVRGKNIVPLEFCGWEKLHPGYGGILEPVDEKPFLLTQDTLIIVPGSVFDRKGNRMGYGKGFYDRYLSEHGGIKIGLAFSFQVLELIESKEHDVPMDFIVTEKEIIDTRKS